MLPTDVVVVSVIAQAVTFIGAAFAVCSIYLTADQSADTIRKAAGRGLSAVAVGALIQALSTASLLVAPGVTG